MLSSKTGPQPPREHNKVESKKLHKLAQKAGFPNCAPQEKPSQGPRPLDAPHSGSQTQPRIKIVCETTPEEWRPPGYLSKKQRFEGKRCQGTPKAKQSLELITMPTVEKVPKMHTKISMGGKESTP